ncbi:hypothetical protein E2562_006240 [Oryza meyeriana var. granulata]|uniref:Uncharacterized protein n=1 Tax=Oryza meyeriana var. granulata TaxID=110450 RepID=A0A6G1CMA2_9ORYZ|nr:hypothetical protein E2562_006240 [Oryza meyeriana var. granulata]
MADLVAAPLLEDATATVEEYAATAKKTNSPSPEEGELSFTSRLVELAVWRSLPAWRSSPGVDWFSVGIEELVGNRSAQVAN